MKISESTNTSVLKPVKGTRKWLVRLITEGQGSTGVYTKEALQGSFAEAFPVGTHMYIDHATEAETDERPEGTLTKLAAVIAETPHWQDAPEPGVDATMVWPLDSKNFRYCWRISADFIMGIRWRNPSF